MSRTKKNKVKIDPFRMTMTVIIIIMLIIVGIRVKKIVDLHLEQNELQKQNEALEDEKNSLKNELKNVNDLDYIEEQARRQLKMIKPGEMLYIMDDEKYKADADKSDSSSDEVADDDLSGDE